MLTTSISLFVIIGFCPGAWGQDDLSYSWRNGFQRPLIKKVVLEGVKSFDPGAIKGLLFSKPNRWFNIFKKRRLSRSNVQYDRGIIERYYKRRGFLFATVTNSIITTDDGKAVIIFRVKESRQTLLSGAGISGGVAEINRKFDRAISDFKEGEPVDESKVLAARFMLRDIYYDNGYPFVRVESGYEFSDDSTGAFVHYVVVESLYAVNGKTSLAKTGFTRPNVIMRELVVKPGKEYSRKDMIESERRLLSTGLFKYLGLMRNDSTIIINGDSCRVDYILNFEERKKSVANIGFSVGQEEDFEVVAGVSGRWGVRNLWGTGRRLFLRTQYVGQITDPEGPLTSLGLRDLERKLKLRFIRLPIELNYVEPWFLNHRTPLTLKVSYEPKTLNRRIRDFEYRYDLLAGEAVFLNELDKFTTARVSMAIEYINIIDVPEDQEEAYRAEGDNQMRRKISTYGERDTRDNFFAPQHGSYSFVGLDYVGGVLGGDFSYVKAQFSWSRYQLFIGQNILATRLWAGFLDDMGREGRSSAEDRFMLGGATTIRGYTENSLGPVFTDEDDSGDKTGKPKGGRYLMLGNIELRRSLFWRFGGSIFVDAGNTYSSIDHITPLSVAFTSGLGLQFFTPVGPIRMDYGVRLKKEFDLGAGNLHLSILYAF
jgi:outer membrane protein insertion porin family